jgi:hypothetical protein
MKLGLRAAMVVLCCLTIASPAFAGTFVNGGFEDGSFNGWTQGAGWWSGGWPMNPTNYLPGGLNYDMSGNASSIVNIGPDPIVGNLLNRVYNGSYAARVNDWYNNYSVSVISQTVTNYTDPHIYFAWAAVLESSHGSTDSDNFTLRLTDDTTGAVLYAVTYDSYDNGSIFNYYGGWYYTNWQVQDLDVSTLQGDTFSLTLLGSDCPYGGHAGYVYLDGFGGTIPPPTTPEPGTLALLGSGAIFAAGWLRRRFL